ncbi:MAG: methyltransferase domain-containing protein [SAR86 cluster bacterium]|jgi:2-polyprenyl-3-methyl-5-hydroxy-6-metoxy-1,4-benzoquinol methylase|nr:methyltransferase domain-containing protein [SAR86 cluster bacterium]
MTKTKDPVNQELIEQENNKGLQKLGLMNSNVWHQDPKRLSFTLARYKFVSKMLEGKKTVAEIGCGDGFCSRIVKQTVQSLLITDYDPYFIEKFKEINSEDWPIESKTHNILEGPLEKKYEAIYSLDVLEHIPPSQENIYMKNIISSLYDNSVLIIGMPSIESQDYASPASKEGHINCKSGRGLKEFMSRYFENVFLFSMNDELVHTGFEKMAHYIIAIGSGIKKV